MNRWKRLKGAFLLLGVAILSVQAVPPLRAQTLGREFPAAAVRGHLTIGMPPEATLDGRAVRLAPGARIRGTNNMLVMSAGLTGQTLPVMVLRDGAGALREVWILSAAEARDQRHGPPPAITNMVSASDEAKRQEEAGRTRYDQQPKYPQR